jgi:hypothetical protein
MSGLYLHPIPAIPGAIGSCPALGNSTLELQALCRLEELHTIIEAFNQVQALDLRPR